jgi:hypothetical protein
VYAGDPGAGERAWSPFRALATPVLDMVGPMPYPAIYAFSEGAGIPHASVVRSSFLDGFDPAAAGGLVEAIADSP